MNKQFYENILPSQGMYCVATIHNGHTQHYFVQSIDELLTAIEEHKDHADVFVTPNSFVSASRIAANGAFSKSFFIDLDVGQNKPYKTKDEAIDALFAYIDATNSPFPYIVDSGNGIHAYWAFTNNIPIEAWKPFAIKLKLFMMQHGLHIDPTVSADVSRIMRAVDSYNYKSDPPKFTSVLFSPEELTNDIQILIDIIGGLELSVAQIIEAAPKGISKEFEELQKAKYDNFETLFADIALKSLQDNGCDQIKYAIVNSRTLEEPLWYAALSIARNCNDWEDAIQELSEDHPDYSHDNTIRKASQTVDKPQGCATFARIRPDGCEKCVFRGKITNPLGIGRKLKAPDAEAIAKADAVREDPNGEEIPAFPESLSPFFRGKNGGIYYVMPDKTDAKGNITVGKTIQVFSFDLYPIRRMFSAQDGAILMMRCVLPKDPKREFPLTLKQIYAQDKLREILSAQEAIFPPKLMELVAEYLYRWAEYMINFKTAENVRPQMGWIEDKSAFVVGTQEMLADKSIQSAPASPLVRSVANMLTKKGTFERWKQSAQMLDTPGLELHAFGMLIGFGSPLMQLSPVTGGTVSFTGRSGGGKSGSLYAALSIYGDPKQMSVFESTDNGMQARAINLKNIPLGVDEATNRSAEELSRFIYWVSQGKDKIRMQSSVNAERTASMTASMIAFLTTNIPVMDSLTRIKASPNGEMARLIEFNLKPLEINEQKATEIFDGFRNNYGFAWEPYIAEVYNIGDVKITEMIEAWAGRFNQTYGADPAYRFYRYMYAVCMTAAEILKSANIVSLDIQRISSKVMLEMIMIRDSSIKLNHVDYKELTSEFFLMHQASLLIVDGDRVIAEPKGNFLTMRVELNTGKCFIVKRQFKEYLSNMKVSTSEYEFATKEDNFLVDSAVKKRMSAGWSSGRDTPPVYAYMFNWNDIDSLVKEVKNKQDAAGG